MKNIDLRPGNSDYSITTAITRDGINYMGPEVVVTARDEDHAVEIVRKAGHQPSRRYSPQKIK